MSTLEYYALEIGTSEAGDDAWTQVIGDFWDGRYQRAVMVWISVEVFKRELIRQKKTAHIVFREEKFE